MRYVEQTKRLIVQFLYNYLGALLSSTDRDNGILQRGPGRQLDPCHRCYKASRCIWNVLSSNSIQIVSTLYHITYSRSTLHQPNLHYTQTMSCSSGASSSQPRGLLPSSDVPSEPSGSSSTTPSSSSAPSSVTIISNGAQEHLTDEEREAAAMRGEWLIPRNWERAPNDYPGPGAYRILSPSQIEAAAAGYTEGEARRRTYAAEEEITHTRPEGNFETLEESLNRNAAGDSDSLDEEDSTPRPVPTSRRRTYGPWIPNTPDN